MTKYYGYEPQPKELTDKQLKLPFFRQSHAALSNITQNRARVLPRLNMHPSGRKVRNEVHETIEKLATAILRRLDLATGTLGWVNEQGRMRLYNQRRLAADAGVSTSSLSRILEFFEDVGYVKRSIKRLPVRQSNLLWTVKTSTTITFTRLFFRDLGATCFYTYSKAKKWALKKRITSQRTQAAQAELKQAAQQAAKLRAAQKKRQTHQAAADALARRQEIDYNRCLANASARYGKAGYTAQQLREIAMEQFRKLHPV